jgi:hypothetical protein
LETPTFRGNTPARLKSEDWSYSSLVVSVANGSVRSGSQKKKVPPEATTTSTPANVPVMYCVIVVSSIRFSFAVGSFPDEASSALHVLKVFHAPRNTSGQLLFISQFNGLEPKKGGRMAGPMRE